MGGASYILAINLFVAGLIAAAFLAVAMHESARPAAQWFAASYLIGLAYLVVEASIPFMADARLPVVGSFAVFLAATIAFNAGLARRYALPFPWMPIAAFFGLTAFAVYLVQDLPRHSFSRILVYQLPYAAMQAMAAGMVFASRRRGRIDRLLAVVLAASAAQFAAKPLIAHALGGWGAAPQLYLQSNYALASQTLGTIFALAVAVLTLMLMVSDVLADATSKTETDALSGLLNQGGFERHAQAAVGEAARKGLPVALVIADLDHFKAINDGFGHAAGNRVIEAFAEFVQQAAAAHHVSGRIGGEEFAIMLPGANLAAARIFAEGMRSAFGSLSVPGLPDDYRCTASFGVAERRPDEALAELMHRADEALYEAKRSGRDCVRATPEPTAKPPDSRQAANQRQGLSSGISPSDRPYM
jgi:diguanylate cyclase (GGDEF)-like protein